MRDEQRPEEPQERELPVWKDTRQPPKQSGWMRYLHRFEVRRYARRDPRSFDHWFK